jgi:two-component system sensor histidine kinase YesM
MKLKLKSKIILSTAIVVIFSLIISGYIELKYFSTVIIKELEEKDKVLLSQYTASVSHIQEKIIRISQYIIIDRETQNNMKSMASDDAKESITATIAIEDKLASAISLTDYIFSAIFVGANGELVSTSDYVGDDIQKNVYPQIENLEVRNFFTAPFSYRTIRDTIKLVSFVHEVPNVEMTGENLGYLIININYDLLIKELLLLADDFEDLAIINEDNQVIMQKGDIIDPINFKFEENQFTDSKDGFTFVNHDLYNNWSVIAYKSYQTVYNKLQYIYLFIILIILASIVVIVLINTSIISSITKPITKLTNAMKRAASGDLKVSVSCSSGDEVQLLTEGFNAMLVDLQTYLDNLMENEKTQRKMQIDLLISQINPHFIYNTLNCVTYMIRKQRNKDAASMVEAFVSILQDTIKVGDEGVFEKVSKEVENVSNYVKIQKFRYPDRFDVIWDVDESLHDQLIPRSIIQPILENAIEHGIYPNKKIGIIKISIKQDEDRILITVKDNGIGIDQAKINKIMNATLNRTTSTKMRSIGLFNIMERLKHIYGKEGLLQIESEIGKGTKVSITLAT